MLAQGFWILLPEKVKIKNSTSSVYSRLYGISPYLIIPFKLSPSPATRIGGWWPLVSVILVSGAVGRFWSSNGTDLASLLEAVRTIWQIFFSDSSNKHRTVGNFQCNILSFFKSVLTLLARIDLIFWILQFFS